MLEKFNHPLVFAITMTLIIFGIRDVAIIGAKKMGWSGIVSFFK